MTQIVRGCGVREKGGIYFECHVNKSGGIPLSNFLICPPVPTDEEYLTSLGITAVGVHLIQDKDGVNHAFNIIGASHYPNVWDYYQELAHFGMSVRVQRTFPFELLSADSKMLLAHPKAIIEDLDAYYDDMEEQAGLAEENEKPSIAARMTCKRNPASEHWLSREMCVGLYEHDVVGGELVIDPEVPSGTVIRQMPSFQYVARKPPLDSDSDHMTGIFMSLPIHNLAVIEGGEYEKSMEVVQVCPIPWELKGE